MNQLLSKKMKTTKNNKGFTLIELIVVIAILGILAAIAIPRFSGMREGANAKSIDANIRTIQSGVEVLAAQENVDVTTIAVDDTGAVTAPTTIDSGALTKLVGEWPAGPEDVTFTVVAGYATANAGTNPPPVPFGYTIDGRTVKDFNSGS